MKITLVLIFLLVIRLIGINQSLWLDEAISVNVAQMPIERIVTDFSINDFHPPVHYWFLNLWIKVFGNEVYLMRLSSVLFSLITVFLVYKIGVEIKNKKLGFWAALFTGLNPLFIYFSQELRMYMMVVMFLTGAFYCFVKINKKATWKNLLMFNILTLLSFVTFYGSAFFIGAIVLYFLINKKIKLSFLTSLGIIMAIGLVSPLLIGQFQKSKLMLDQVTNWGLVLGNVNLKNLLLIPLKFTVGKISWQPKSFYYLVSGTATFLIWSLVFKNMIKDKMLRFILVIPIVLGIIFSFKSPLLQYFRFLYLIPIMALLLAFLKNKLIKVFIFLIFLTFSLIYLMNPKMHREDWKSVALNLNSNPVYMISSFGDPIRFYNPKAEIKDVKSIEAIEDEIQVISYGQEIHGINIQKELIDLGYQKIEEKNFRAIVLENWQK